MTDHIQEPEKAQRLALSLYPRHIRIIQEFARETVRTDSNAVQFIIEDWARIKQRAIVDAQPEAA